MIKYVVFILIAPFVLILSTIDLLIMCLTLIFLLFKNKDINKYIKNNFIGVDQRVNALLFGDEDETMSSRMGKRLVLKKDCFICRFICGLLNKIDKNHCVDAIEHDRGEKIRSEKI